MSGQSLREPHVQVSTPKFSQLCASFSNLVILFDLHVGLLRSVHFMSSVVQKSMFPRWLMLSILALVAAMDALSRVRRRVYYTIQALHRPAESAWQRMWEQGTDRDLLMTVGFTRDVFNVLLERFSPLYDPNYARTARGRPRLLAPHAALALSLQYMSSMMRQYELCQLYGVSPSTLSRTLTRSLECLLAVLRSLHAARVRWPKASTRRRYAQTIAGREPQVTSAFGFVDGTTFRIEQPAGELIQNAYYSGVKSDTVVQNLFVFAPDGTIIWARTNCPGSWHDSQMGMPLFSMLQELTDGTCLIGDSAFPNTRRMQGRVLRPFKRNELSDNAEERVAQLSLHRVITSLRQAVEWGNK